jgi:uncharacterized protein YjbJ (UPF0337 family)
MNKDRIEGGWKQMKGNMKERWGKFMHDDYLIINGRREQRLGKRQLRFGLASEQADRDVARLR